MLHFYSIGIINFYVFKSLIFNIKRQSHFIVILAFLFFYMLLNLEINLNLTQDAKYRKK